MYKFVKIPKMTIIIRKSNESFSIIRTKNFDNFGKNLCISKPMANGTSKLIAISVTCTYGTPKFARSKIDLPSKNNHRGIVPNDARVEIVVIEIDKFMLPPHRSVQILLAPPAGLIPVRKRPSASSGFSGNRANPNP